MGKSEMRPVERTQGKAPEAYYYLGRFLEDCQRIQSHRFLSPEDRYGKLNRLVVRYFGSEEEDGMLQEDLNRYYHGILKDLQRDHPQFTRKMILVFSYTAARLPRSMICMGAKISSEGAVSCLRSRMKKVIATHVCERTAEYLDLLSR